MGLAQGNLGGRSLGEFHQRGLRARARPPAGLLAPLVAAPAKACRTCCWSTGRVLLVVLVRGAGASGAATHTPAASSEETALRSERVIVGVPH